MTEIDTRQRSLLLVDLSGIFWRNWHATADQSVGEAFNRTVNKVRSLADGFDYVAVCCDVPPYKRKELSPDYKAQRDKPEATAVEQFRLVRKRLRDDGYLLWGVKGYEADDVIATAARCAIQDGMDITIASADKDLLQLVCPSVSVLSINSGDTLRAPDVVEKFGVTPALLGDLLALMGDASDNVRGVRGIGAKSAAKLIQEIGPLVDILAAAEAGDERIKPKMREALVAAGKEVLVSRQLVQLYTDVPITWGDLYEKREAKPLTNSKGWDGDDMPYEQPDSDPVNTKPEPETVAEPMPDAPPAASVEIVPAPPSEPQAAIVVAPQSFERQLEPASPRDAYKLACVLHNSRMWQSFGSADAIMGALLVGRGLGLNATQSLQGIDVIKGRPTLKTVTLIGLIKTSDKCRFWRMIESNDERATFETHRDGDPEPTRYTMTMAEAQKAGWSANDQWRKQPATMLRWRCQSTLARIVYPDVCAGLYTPDEMLDAEV